MKQLPLVSIALLSYNRPQSLKRALHALEQQHYPNIELLVSDDASTDKEVIDFLKKYEREKEVQVFFQAQNLGIIKNHQFLLSKIRGKYILWASDDDDWHPELVQACVQALEQNPDAVLCSSNVSYQIDGEKKNLPYYENIDTQGMTDPLLRYEKVVKNILWWNHAFYGLVRAETYQKLSLKQQFAFDISFVLELSLLGTFIKIPQYYFSKSVQGIGSTVHSNLKAVKVKSRLIRAAPRLGTALLFVQNISSYKGLRWGQKWRLLRRTIAAIRRNEMYPIARQTFWYRVLKFSTWLKEYRSFKRDLYYLPHDEVLHQLYPLGIPVRDVSYDAASQELRLLKLGIAVKRGSSILRWYQDLLQLSIDFDVQLEQDEGGTIFLSYKDYRIVFKEGYYSFLIREVWIKEVYKADLQEPTVVFDVGANIGLAAIYFAQQEAVTQVYGFEPFEETAGAARENIALNLKAKEKVRLFTYGLAGETEDCTVDFSFQASQLATVLQSSAPSDVQGAPTKVQLRKASVVLSELLNKHPQDQKLLKVDCEGSEYAIFADLAEARLLAAFDFIVLEWHEQGDEPLLHILRENGFRSFSIDWVYSEKYGNTGMIYASRC